MSHVIQGHSHSHEQSERDVQSISRKYESSLLKKNR